MNHRLNLRTIQRIEREASASLQSKKALASVNALMTKVVYTLFLKHPAA
jgi:hypothetical protein